MNFVFQMKHNMSLVYCIIALEFVLLIIFDLVNEVIIIKLFMQTCEILSVLALRLEINQVLLLERKWISYMISYLFVK